MQVLARNLSTVLKSALLGISIAIWAWSAPMASAASSNCITDAELEAAVGPQLQAGAFAVRTDSLGDRPMCSGLTIARAVQYLRQNRYPVRNHAAPPPPSQAPLRAAQAPASPPASRTAASLTALNAYVGKYPGDKIGGYMFRNHPAVANLLRNARVPASVMRKLATFEVHGPIANQNGVIVEGGCFPHHCDELNYRLFVSQVSGNLALCVYDNGAMWFSSTSGSDPMALPGNCLVSPAEVPLQVRGVLGPGAGSNALQPNGRASVVPDISRTLVFQNASMCESEAWDKVIYLILDRKPAPIGPLGSIRFRRTGPDKDGYFDDSADINASWNGLSVTRLEFTHKPDTDSTSRAIIFKEAATVVQATLNRLGFNIRRIGELREVGNEMPVSIMLDRRRTGSALSCGT